MNDVVGLRELRQHASEVVRRVEDGHPVTITVNGRPAARMVPVAPRRWVTWADVAEVLAGPGAPSLLDDVREWEDEARDPFASAP